MRKILIKISVAVILLLSVIGLVACSNKEVPLPGLNVAVMRVSSIDDLRIYMGKDYLLPSNDRISSINIKHGYKSIWQEEGKPPVKMDGIKSVSIAANYKGVSISIAINVIDDYGYMSTPVPPNAIAITDEIAAMEIIDADSNIVSYIFFLSDIMYNVTDSGIRYIFDNLSAEIKQERAMVLREFMMTFRYKHLCP